MKAMRWALAWAVFCGLSIAAGCGSKETDATTEADAANAAATQAAANAEDKLHPIVRLHTTAGDIVLKLDAENAPLTVENFLHYVNSGYYSQTIFHYVDAGGVIAAGGYTAELREKPASRPPLRNEAHNGLKNTRGTIAMMRDPAVIDSARCQFFINIADNPALDFREGERNEDYGYCVFGEVVEGLEVIESIAKSPVQANEPFEKLPARTVLIESATKIR